jgi:hypothetical protein
MDRLIVKHPKHSLESSGDLGRLRKMFLKLYITFNASLGVAQKKQNAELFGVLLRRRFSNLFISNALSQSKAIP